MKFSDFMRNATPEEKKRVILEVLKEANEEQKKYMKPFRERMKEEAKLTSEITK